MTTQKILSGAIVAGVLLTAATAFAETTSSTGAGTSSNATKIACVGAAVNAREQSIDAAMTAFNTATNAAYTARATALQQAYSLTTVKEVKAAVKTAWSTFKSSAKSARKTWQSARDGAWSTYRKAAVACKAPAGTGDGANAESEASGD